MSWAEWEGIAAQHLEASCIGTPVDPWLLAWSLELEVRVGPPGIGTLLDDVDDVIYVDPLDRRERQGFRIAHECGHALAIDHGCANTEAAASGIASCLVLPRIDFIRDRRRTGGCILALRELHPWASAEVLLRRMVGLDNAVGWVWDAIGPRRRRYPIITPGLRWPRRDPLPIVRETMEAALESRCTVELLGGVRAWCIEDPPWVRILCLGDLEVLMSQVA